MSLLARVVISLLIALGYAAALIVLITAVMSILPLLVGTMILSALALTGLFWVWRDFPYKDK